MENDVQVSKPQRSKRETDIPRIAVVSDNEKQAQWLCATLDKAGYRVDVFNELTAFPSASLTIEPPSAVVIAMMSPESDDAGVQVIAELKKHSLNDIPLIFISARADMPAKLAAYRAGATHYLAEPVDSNAVLRVIADAVMQTPAEPFRVLLVDDNDGQRAAYGLTLRQAGMTVTETGDPFQVPEILKGFAAEVLVLDMLMPECSGPELAVILRDDERYAQIPIVYLAAETHGSRQFQTLNCSGDHFLSKPVNAHFLVNAVASHARRFRQAQARMESMRATLYERERQQQALDVHAIVSVTDTIGTLIYVNDRFCRTSGYSRDELLGKNHRIVKSSEHPPEFYFDMWRTIAGGNIWRGEVCNRRKDGRLYWVETSIVPFLDNTGLPYQYVSIRTDITHIKEAELRLRLLERAVEASTSSISMADAIQPHMPLIYVNPAFERITGYGRDEVIGRNCRFLQGKDVDQPGLNEIRQALREGRAGEALVHNYRKDGTPFWNDLRIAPVHDEQGRLSHFIGISDDVTERKQYEQEIIAARDEAQRANNAKSEFLSNMSHELRTPMNAILGFGQLLEIDSGLNEDQADYVSEILKAGRHLLELINEVLDLAKIESGNINLSLEPLSCVELIKECLTLIRPIAQAKGIAVNNDVAGDCLIHADRTRLKQVLINLLSNAVKYNRPQGEVSIQADEQGDRIRLKVSDTGYGIPVERWQEIFQPFSRLGAEDADIEGTGIGLTISSHLMKMMGGAIGMESEEGQGSTFWIELPPAASEPGIRNHGAEQLTPSEPASAAEYCHTLLYIEDNPANLRLVAQILRRHSQLRLITAHTPELGLELVSAHHPDLVLLDINLPGMDGYQVLSVLRSLDSTKKIPVIGISANATAEDVRRAMAAGFDCYMTKPIDVGQLLEAVSRLLADDMEE